MFNGCSVVFSDKFMGSFLVPSENSWNYNFHGIQFSSSMSYDMISDIPREYYDPVDFYLTDCNVQIHRPEQFRNFCDIEQVEQPNVDRDNVLERDDLFN